MKLAATTLLLLLATPAPQDAVQQIRARYERVEAEQKAGTLESVRAEIRTTKPAIGPQSRELLFLFATHRDEETNAASHELLEVRVDYSIAASTKLHLEYLLAPDGKLVFHYRKAEGYECGERRYYLQGDRLIRLKSSAAGECVEGPGGVRHPAGDKAKQFSPQEELEAQALVEEAGEYRAAFERLMRLDRLDRHSPAPLGAR